MLELFVVIALAGALHYVTRPKRHPMLRDRSNDVLNWRDAPPLRADLRNGHGRFTSDRNPERIPARW